MLEWYPRLVLTVCVVLAFAATIAEAASPRGRGFNW
jgi:hypothetical protein